MASPTSWDPVAGAGGVSPTVLELTPGTGTFTATDGKIVGGMWDRFDLFDPGGNFTNIVEDGGASPATSILNTAIQGAYFRPGTEKGDKFDDEALCLTLDAIGDWSVTIKGKKAVDDTHVYWGPGAHWQRGNDSAFALTTCDGGTDRVWARAVVGVEIIGYTAGSTVVSPTSNWNYRTRRVGKDIIYEESTDGTTWTTIRAAEDDVVGSFTKIGLIFGNWTSHVGIVTIEEMKITYTPPP